jgi:hypothetical protein
MHIQVDYNTPYVNLWAGDVCWFFNDQMTTQINK